MRRENLPDGVHDKVIWKRIRDRSRDKASRQRNSKTWLRPTTATLLSVSFGSYRRRLRDVLMGRCGYVPLRRLGAILMRPRWAFHLRLMWDVVEAYWWEVVINSPWDVLTTFQYDVVKTNHWDVLATFHWSVVGCFSWDVPATSLRRTETRRYDVLTTCCCRVVRRPHNMLLPVWRFIHKYFSFFHFCC